MLNRIGPLRKRHRVALPLLPVVYGRLRVDADVVICSSSGWSHGVATDAPKIVYCHNPARWVYQRAEYSKTRKRYWLASTVLLPLLKRWDQAAASGCARYIANSSSVARRIEDVYGRDAEVLPPPTSLDVDGEQEPVKGLEPGFVLSISRLLGYKNIDQVTEAFAGLPHERLVVVGDGPYRPELIASAPSNVMFTGRVTDAAAALVVRQLRGARERIVRGLRADARRSGAVRQAECAVASGWLPRHDGRGHHGVVLRRAGAERHPHGHLGDAQRELVVGVDHQERGTLLPGGIRAAAA